jgi:molecular chaperone DnaK (HSP70)
MAGGTGKLVGIDLGTTFSAIASLDDHGQPVTLPDRDGDMLTPSAVLLLDDGGAVVGHTQFEGSAVWWGVVGPVLESVPHPDPEQLGE